MQKIWWVVGLLLVGLIGAGGAMRLGYLGAPAGLAALIGPAQASAAAQGSGKGGDKKNAPEVALEFTPREVVHPAMTTMAAQVQFSGPLVAPGTAIVRSKAAGTLLSLQVEEGQQVRAGQVLGRIDLAEVASRIAERQAMLESARAQLAQAERTLGSNQSLADQKFISANALDGSRAAVDTARAQVNAAKAALDTTQLALRDANLVAPIAGVVAKKQVVAGEKLSLEQPLLTIVDLARLELVGSVATHEVSRLRAGMHAQIKVEGHDAPINGRIARIAPAAEAGTRAISVTVELANPGQRFRAGQYALAQVTLADDKPRLTLPSTAVGSSGGEHHVWVIANGQLQRRSVLLGRRDEHGERIELLEGVSATAQVLAARFDNLREGRKALVVAVKPAPLASASSPVGAR